MIISVSGIYVKIFSLAFVIEEPDKIQFGWEISSCLPHLNTFTRFSIFFELTAMLTGANPTSSESFIKFGSVEKMWVSKG